MPATPLEPGDIFAGYVVERQLGSGGMGEVYQVRHTELPKSFALKILPPALSNDASFAARFRREMETVSRLDHPNIVMTTDGGSFNGQIWFTMTYVAGTDAQNAMGTPPSGLPAQHVAHIIDEISSALDYAHDQGVLHRDIKPANILLAGAGLTPNGRVFLTDFGIAKAIDDVRSITTTSQAPMTLDFASPEQINGKHLDRRTDVYSLGATLFALLTGSVPFPGIPEAKIHGHCTAAPPRPTTLKPGLTGAFDEVIRIAMAKDPRQRYQTCGQLASATRLAANTSLGVRTAVDATLTEQITSTLPTAIPRVRPARRRSWLVLALPIAAVVVLAGTASLLWADSDHGTTTAGTAEAPTAQTTPAGTVASNGAASTANSASNGSGDAASASASMRQPTAPTAAQPLASLLNPPPDRRPGTLNGTAVAGAAAYAMEPKNCSLGSQRITVDLNGQYDRVAGNIQLDDAAPASTRTQFAATADGVALDDFVLSPKAGASFDLSVKDRATLEISLESLGQGSCESDDYLVLVTSALAYPRQP